MLKNMDGNWCIWSYNNNDSSKNKRKNIYYLMDNYNFEYLSLSTKEFLFYFFSLINDFIVAASPK